MERGLVDGFAFSNSLRGQDPLQDTGAGFLFFHAMKAHHTLLAGGLLAIAGTTLFTGKVIVAKLMYAHGMSPSGVLALRMSVALPFFLAPALRDLWTARNRMSLRDLAFTCLMGVMGYYVASMFDFVGVQYISTSLERMILNMYPSVVMLLGLLFLRRKFEPRLLVSLLLGYAGIGIMMHEEFALASTPGERPLLGAAFVLCSVLTYSVSVLGAESVIQRVGPRRFTSLAMTAACFAILTHYVAQSGFTLPSRDPQVLGLGLFLGFFCTVVAAYSFNTAVKLLGAQRVGLFSYLGAGITFTVAAAVLGEAFTVLKVLGICVAASGALVVMGGGGHKPAPQPAVEPQPARA